MSVEWKILYFPILITFWKNYYNYIKNIDLEFTQSDIYKLKTFKGVIYNMEKQTAGRDNLGELAPKFAELNDDVLFGEVRSREDKMSLRDRSMITISALMA
mgnify:CR=1 FL=1